MNAKLIKMRFIDAPIGARFIMPICGGVYIKINAYDDGLVVRWNGNIEGYQSHCCWIDEENGINFNTLIDVI